MDLTIAIPESAVPIVTTPTKKRKCESSDENIHNLTNIKEQPKEEIKNVPKRIPFSQWAKKTEENVLKKEVEIEECFKNITVEDSEEKKDLDNYKKMMKVWEKEEENRKERDTYYNNLCARVDMSNEKEREKKRKKKEAWKKFNELPDHVKERILQRNKINKERKEMMEQAKKFEYMMKEAREDYERDLRASDLASAIPLTYRQSQRDRYFTRSGFDVKYEVIRYDDKKEKEKAAKEFMDKMNTDKYYMRGVPS